MQSMSRSPNGSMIFQNTDVDCGQDGNTSMGYGGVTAAYSGYEAVPGMAQWSYGTSNIS